MRSPNYPQLSLPEALNKAQILYAAIHTAKTTPEKAAEKLGYTSLNGRSMGVLSALKKYGLLAGKGEELTLTHDAVIIFERPDEHPEKQEAIRRLALSPPLFADIYSHFNGQTPGIGDLRVYLSKMGFSKTALDEITQNYAETFQLVTKIAGEYTADDPSSDKGEKQDMSASQSSPQSNSTNPTPTTPANPGKGKTKEWSFPLSFQRNIDAVVTIHGDKLKRRDLEVLEKKVRDLIDAWEDEEDAPKDE